MTFSENDQEESFMRFQPPINDKRTSNNKTPSTAPRKRYSHPYPSSSPPPELQPNQTNSNEFSWPILLAIVPTLGTFFAGSAEIWSDFVMILLILYYVYKWMTVPWSYYESARSRRLIHFNATYHNSTQSTTDDGKKGKQSPSLAALKQQEVANELRRHELIGLVWVLASPAVAGYTLQFSRYFLSDYERYMSSFNVAVFVLAASLKPLSHVMLLLRERTMYLQSEIQINETHVQRLQKKLDIMEDELYSLKQAFATKKDLGQVADNLSPTIQQLTKAIRRFEKKEQLLRSWSEDKFTFIDEKVHEFDQFICYKIDQDQRLAKHSTVATLVLLPINIAVWMISSMTGLLPVPRALLGAAPPSNVTNGSSASYDLPSISSAPVSSSSASNNRPLSHKSSSSSLRNGRSSAFMGPGKHLAHSDLLSCPTTPDPTSVAY